MRPCIIFNPTARGDKARKLGQHLDALASECVLRPTTGPGAACGLAREAVEQGVETLVAAGGDGTVNEVLNGIASVPDGLDRARLAILPLGTMNVFARELNLPLDLPNAWRIIQEGRETRIDLPQTAHGSLAAPIQTRFAQMAGAGLDSRAIALVDWRWKKRFGPLAYVIAGLRALSGPQPVITVQAGPHRAMGELVLIGNGRFYGGHLPIFPDADCRDGLLEVRVFPRSNWVALVRFGWSWISRRPFHLRGEQSFRLQSLTLTSSEPVPFEVDGDNVGHLPAAFSVRARALRVVAPAWKVLRGDEGPL